MDDWKQNLKKTEPYTPGEQLNIKGLIKLNTNENPYLPSPKVREALENLEPYGLKLYPNPDGEPLRSGLAKYHGVDAENIFLGNGSDEVLAFAFPAFFNSERPILFPEITYSFYKVWAEFFRVPYKTVPMGKGFEIDVSGFFAENGGILIANPNAPTGMGLGLRAIESILEKNPGSVVILDEAYVDFGGETALPLLKKYENLLIVRTFSKSRALAGMRIGYAIGGKLLIDTLNGVKNSFNSYTINRASAAAGCAALKDEKYFSECVKKVIATRERAIGTLREMGFSVCPSSANFIFVTNENLPAAKLQEFLRGSGILVRHFPAPGIDNYLRISIGSDYEMDRLFEKINEFAKQGTA